MRDTDAADPGQPSRQETNSASRVVGVDAFRGFVMLLMMAEVLRLSQIAKRIPGNAFWDFVAHHQSHVAWVGCSLHDLIQPSFSFLVGVALPFSLASRIQQGQSRRALILHAAWRALVLVALGILLRSMHSLQTNFTFEDTLSQIGLGYLVLFFFGLVRPKWTWIGFVVILVGYFAAFALYPLPAEDFDYPAVGVPADWSHHAAGFAAHWNKNSNLAWAFDTWFLNLFPREQPFTHNTGGYSTLSFIPTLCTMLLGLVAGGWLRRDIPSAKKAALLLIAGVGFMVIGFAANRYGICPNVKRIWTPSWTLFSGGWCFLMLAGFYLVCDIAKFQGWAFALRVVGANSIAAYCIAHLLEDFLVDNFRIHFGQNVFQMLGEAYEPLVQGAAVLISFWLILYWMYRNKIFLKV